MLPLATIFGSDWGNAAIQAALLAWLAAQLIKFGTEIFRNRQIDFTYFVSTGGMPSAHSASVCGLATRIGLDAGLHTPIFALALWFAIIVMFDAQSVRKAAGEQAKILNQIRDELKAHHHLPQDKLKELLGHTRLEVFAGAIVGILVGLTL